MKVGLQLPFSFLPSGWHGFGCTGNVTCVNSDTVHDLQGPATSPLGTNFPALTRTSRQERLLGLSTWSANAML